jgi:hypothetical protein
VYTAASLLFTKKSYCYIAWLFVLFSFFKKRFVETLVSTNVPNNHPLTFATNFIRSLAPSMFVFFEGFRRKVNSSSLVSTCALHIKAFVKHKPTLSHTNTTVHQYCTSLFISLLAKACEFGNNT